MGGWELALLAVPAVLALLIAIGIYVLAITGRGGGPWKRKGKSRSAAILRVFEAQYREGRITREQFEVIIRQYSE
jgi:uncharacterized membrane protein